MNLQGKIEPQSKRGKKKKQKALVLGRSSGGAVELRHGWGLGWGGTEAGGGGGVTCVGAGRCSAWGGASA